MKALIIGCGIGGLATALMLHQRGIDCELYEQEAIQGPLDFGINVLPPAVDELSQLGLLDRLDAVALRTYESIYTDATGQEIRREICGAEAGRNYPQLSIHRGNLQEILYNTAQARLGNARIHRGHQLGSITQDESGVTAYFFDQNRSHCRSARGDILIGADGIHSTVRSLLFSNDEAPRFSGTVLWCGAHDWSSFLTGRSIVNATAVACTLQLYPIADGSRANRRLTSWGVLAELDQALAAGLTHVPSRTGRLEDVMPYVRRFNIPYCDSSALIEATPEFWEYPLYDSSPLTRWSLGLATLLGDAAHATYPVISNGASRAILDARCLADSLIDAEHPRHALFMYEQERRHQKTRAKNSISQDYSNVVSLTR